MSTLLHIRDDAAPARAHGVHTVVVDDEAVLLDPARERLHHLNSSAAILWQCIDGSATLAEIAADLSEVMGVAFETVMAETLTVARDLLAEGLIVPGDPHKSP